MASSKELDFEFVLVETNLSNQLKAFEDKLSDEEKMRIPPTLLPFGLPPVQPSFEDLLRKRLEEAPDKMSIHSPKAINKNIPRVINFSSLYSNDFTSIPTDIKVDRNPTTGDLIGYHEEVVSCETLTAENSCSLSRQPNAPTTALRGLTTNYPFWPGGMDEIDLTKLVDDEEEIDFEKNLLTCPPGFNKGINFDKNLPTSNEDEIEQLLSEFQIEDIDEVTDEITNEEVESEPSSLEEVVDETVVDAIEEEKLIKLSKKPIEKVHEWAININVTKTVDNFHQLVPNMAHTYPFELDTFQKQAVLRLENNESVFVAAHTSAGKTVVAEYAIALAAKHMTRVIYTSPIKALSNQKFRDLKKTFGDVGLITGDIQINSNAFCLVMTTEILRSMLYNGSDVIRDLEWVVFDEVHYINDKSRGVVWEEVLIMLPDRCNVILLSATTPNTMEFANWVGKIKQKKIYVISTLKRPVPLVHHLYTGNSMKTNNEMFIILDSNKTFNTIGYKKAVAAKHERMSKFAKTFSKTGNSGAKGVWLSLMSRLKKLDQLPVIAFTLSRKRCDDNAESLRSLDLTSAQEKSEIHVFFNKCLQKLKGKDRELPQVLQIQDILQRGVGIHHSGILPILKEVVELLFSRGLVKLLFATETFAMGVNMPARTVAFDRIDKFDGTQKRDLLPGEYIQMAGRAGRRGLDPTGNVIIICQNDVPEMSDLYKMMLGRPSKLQSQFRLTYSMILNLLRVEQLRVEEVMKRSFSEFHQRKDSKIQEEEIKDLEKKLGEFTQIAEIIESTDYRQYLDSCNQLLKLRSSVMKHALTSAGKASSFMNAGRVILLNHPNYLNHLAVILKISSDRLSCTCLVLCEEELHHKNTKWDPETMLGRKVFIPSNNVSQAVVTIQGDEIAHILRDSIKIEPKKIILDDERRKVPRFSQDTPSACTILATQQLMRIAENSSNDEEVEIVNVKTDLGINNMEKVEEIIKIKSIESSIKDQIFSCVHHPMFNKQVKEIVKYLDIEKKIEDLKYQISEDSLHLLPEYQQRIQVLRELNYIDKSNAVQLKGRVACELNNLEVVLTELVFENVFSSLEPTEIVALLSCVPFQHKVEVDDEKLPQNIKEGISTIRSTATNIWKTQNKFGMPETLEDFLNELQFGLVEVVYEWAKGTSFKNITDLTEVQEGEIVRTIQRLNETCKDVRNAARVIGDPLLYAKMETCSELIKRDIVFAASLYTQ